MQHKVDVDKRQKGRHLSQNPVVRSSLSHSIKGYIRPKKLIFVVSHIVDSNLEITVIIIAT
jgi:hypothetical protein